MQKVAFFDIDGTVFRGSLLIELVEELIRSGAFPTEVRSRYHESYTAWRDREESYEKYAWDVVLAFEAHIQGLHYGVLKDAGRRVVESQGRQIYRYTRDLIYDLKKKGYSIVAISQSPKLILDEFCRDHGFDKVYGRIYEIGPRDLLTGVVVLEERIKNKDEIVDRFLSHETHTLKGSVGVGDTESDISFLSKVETPICFNPNQKLYEHAIKEGWRVVVERKDVVYMIQ